jgi:hypothetical protein
MKGRFRSAESYPWDSQAQRPGARPCGGGNSIKGHTGAELSAIQSLH